MKNSKMIIVTLVFTLLVASMSSCSVNRFANATSKENCATRSRAKGSKIQSKSNMSPAAIRYAANKKLDSKRRR